MRNLDKRCLNLAKKWKDFLSNISNESSADQMI